MDLSFLKPDRSLNVSPRKSAKNKQTTYKKDGPKMIVASSDFAEKKPHDDDDDDDKSSSATSTSTAKGKSKSTSKSKPVKSSELDAKDVPIPAPDTGLYSTQPLVIHTGILPVVPSQPTTLIVAPHTLGSGFSSLPSLTAFATSTVTPLSQTHHLPTGSPDGTSRALGTSQPARTGSKHLPVVLIVLVTIGVAFLLLGGFLCWRVRSRPRKRTCPTPSLPILQDAFTDREFKVDEESLFGGKERSSALARPNSDGLYTWVQYTPKPSEALSSPGMKNVTTKPPLPPMMPTPPSAQLSEKVDRFPTPVHVPLPINNLSPNPPMQQMQSALTRAANRVSTLSMSIYPASPQSTTTHTGIGLAIGGTSPLTADGTPVLERKPSKDRLSKARRSYRHSVAATEYLDIYSGAQVTSPTSPTSPQFVAVGPLKSALRKSTSGYAQGRARVKAGYTPGANNAPLRASSTVAGITTLGRAGDRSSFMAPSEEQELQYILPPLSSALKSDVRKERDTRALTSALGLASPSPQYPMSPAPTLTPDDSITLAGDRQRANTKQRGERAHSRTQSEAMSPCTEASARLGNLMLAEFTSMASLPSTRTMAGGGAGGAGGAKSRTVPRKNVSRMDDRPPRVPSPPPLPSLAQMAMAHANPEEYADYRSPTYSIYGLYEAERKSRMPGNDGQF